MNDLISEKEIWYTIEELAELCGLGKDRLNQVLPKFCNQLQNSNNVKFGGYHNTKKFYSENVLKALKQYQLRNSAPNALQNKETAIQGNVSYVQNQTIEAILDNPKALMELVAQSTQRLLEAQPKIEWYDNVADSTNLTEIGTVGKITGIGEKNILRQSQNLFCEAIKNL